MSGGDGVRAQRRDQPSAAEQLRAWLTVGLQSVGGGAGTLYLIRRVFVLQRRWIGERVFVDDWALSRITPGIHMIALAALIGRRVGARRGVVLALVGLLAPSVSITLLLTVGLDTARDVDAVRRLIAGMGPAALGLAIGVSVRLSRAAMRSGHLAVPDLVVLVTAIAAGILAPLSPVIVIAAGALVGVLFLGERQPANHGPLHDQQA